MKKITYYTNSGQFDADELLPCPFCGGDAGFSTTGNDRTKKRSVQIICKSCFVKRITGAITFDLEWCGRKAIKLWNTRHTNTFYIKCRNCGHNENIDINQDAVPTNAHHLECNYCPYCKDDHTGDYWEEFYCDKDGNAIEND